MDERLAWATREARRGDIGAMLHLAYSFLDGHGVKPDRIQARRWFLKAAQVGDLEGMRQYLLLGRSAGS
jgi:TPR repeat protein